MLKVTVTYPVFEISVIDGINSILIFRGSLTTFLVIIFGNMIPLMAIYEFELIKLASKLEELVYDATSTI